MDIFRNEFYISVGYECLQSDVVYVFLGAIVKARCAFFCRSYALLLHLPEVFNEQINDDDDDDERTFGSSNISRQLKVKLKT